MRIDPSDATSFTAAEAIGRKSSMAECKTPQPNSISGHVKTVFK